MLKIDKNQNVTMHQGDTGGLAFVVVGRQLAEDDRFVFGIKRKATGEPVFKQICALEESRIYIHLKNPETELLPPGNYIWSLRAVYGANADVTNGEAVDTLIQADFKILEVAANV